jgi:chorismate dehydratase
VLLIGDPVVRFALGRPDHRIWNLGAAWKEWTGLPSVFAVWAMREPAATGALADGLREARKRGLVRLPEWIDHRPEFTRQFRQAYLVGHIRHGRGDREKAGLARFRQSLGQHLGRARVQPRFV